jgi:hypothetical protein
MARTKSGEITSKIVQAEALRLRGLRQDPQFQTDLKQLEQTAKRLPSMPLIPPSEVTESNWHLPVRSEKKFQEWSKKAKAFLDRWGFKPYLTETNNVELFIHAPVTLSISLDTGNVTDVKLNTRYHPLGDAVALAKRYQALRLRKRTGVRPRQTRRHLETMALRLKARELRKKKLPDDQIAFDLFPDEYEKLLKRNPEAEARLVPLISKYLDSPYKLKWPEAQDRASKELGLDLRTDSAKLKPLLQRVRDLLK